MPTMVVLFSEIERKIAIFVDSRDSLVPKTGLRNTNQRVCVSSSLPLGERGSLNGYTSVAYPFAVDAVRSSPHSRVLKCWR